MDIEYYINIITNFIIGIIANLIIYILLLKYNVKLKGPNSNIIKKNIYKFKNKCYKFYVKPYICPSYI